MTDIVDLQSDPKILKDLENILKKVNASGTLDAFIVSLIRGQDHLTECYIGQKKQMNDLETKVAVLEKTQRIIGGISSKVGLLLLSVFLASYIGLIIYVVKKL